MFFSRTWQPDTDDFLLEKAKQTAACVHSKSVNSVLSGTVMIYWTKQKALQLVLLF